MTREMGRAVVGLIALGCLATACGSAPSSSSSQSIVALGSEPVRIEDRIVGRVTSCSIPTESGFGPESTVGSRLRIIQTRRRGPARRLRERWDSRQRSEGGLDEHYTG
jgi:hypothetical protein